MITGSLVALITPMKSNGDVDKQKLDELIEFHLEAGTHGIVAVGTTGESATLTYEEHADVIRQVVETVKGRVPVIAGTGANSTHEAIDLTQRAKQAGADACLLVTPYYNKPTQEGLYQHFKAIAEAVDIPQILYNVPGRTACDMSNGTVLRLTGIANIVGIKDATGDLSRAKELIEAAPSDFAVYSGDDPTAVGLMLLGGKGNISVTANVAPKQVAQAAEAAIAGDKNTAEKIDQSVSILHEKLFVESNPIPVKWACAELGLCDFGIRLPLTVLSNENHDIVREALTQAGIAK
ncbi:4-hydroxy-tetrahydrodipicolinate synthase [Marinomonas mediterranea]|jgi:dihydrodipicolinate synthase (EC 4.2.1.52)|uniref:4-hydroxy-tetrahydrodipicolinate synthase n=1 Tax=Marinomonas mediterranea (strain ATCC 700492 / JCM 21426 / NBRC 103028 / MMB-1) TaxID=717774 RepID=F2K2U8_MARM1|nr:4-hydroxy-tetrahydrodipicolinate synthase [Marinomonas mediterranea]ADZ91231.1 Dihydrodipicolinate synthase [Marinomonas mediterranea MMB-1]WCN09206.1 4-hydroxy-tetrahydrodipicolinate synthase [Marinomonas mediterranea]WCN13289.1 4-hydroxy-tetrahydrodipicolinate synthase [Marinomonas mediterranea]WCN17357.1 4-hydroxy-tetrahydrodipicolinate synthase [Marinomonas mediterranea MMB-1]